MNAIRQHQAGGKLLFESVPVPQPGHGEVLVKMHASPVNPSDLALLKGNYLVRKYPFIPGLEGSGMVVASGGGLLPGLRIGKRVACTADTESDGTWAEYMKTPVMRTIPLPHDLSSEQGAMMLVNPMTAMAFLHIARKGRHKAIVNNAAASTLGKMLIRLTGRYQIPLINIVRREEQVAELKNMGAIHVLNSERVSFESELKQLSNDLGANLFLDAVTGKQASLLLRAAPTGTTLIAYARLSGEPLMADPGNLIKEEKQIIGFQLGNWLQTKSTTFKLRFVGRVKKHLSDSLSSHIHLRMPLEAVEEAISVYRENMSLGKVILTIGPSDSNNNQ
jgi:NADPH:quinone reductase-like Zn-dependent oxidoreductase